MKKQSKNCNNQIYLYQNYIVGNDFKINFSKSILDKSIIKNKEKFLKIYVSYLKKHNICKIFFYKCIDIILDDTLSINDKLLIKNVFEELYYRVNIINDTAYIKLTKKDSYLINGNKLKLYYIDKNNIKKKVVFDNLTKSEILNIIQNRINNNIYLINCDYNIKGKNYYVLPEKDKFFLKNSF